MNKTDDGAQIGRGVVNLSGWDLPTLLSAPVFLAFFLTFLTFLFLERFSESRIAFAASLWVIAYSLATIVHRRFQARRGRLSPSLLSLRGTETGRLLYVEYVERRGIDLFLYLLLFAVGSFSAVVWWPSIPILPVVYSMAVYYDWKGAPIISSPRVLGISEGLWLSLLVFQPTFNLPLVLQQWIFSSPSGMIFWAALFWTLQIGGLASALHLHWKANK